MGRSQCGLAVVSAGGLAALCGSALAIPPGVRVVNHLAAPGGDGRTWQTAYDDLQVALAAALGSTEIEQIWVAQGVYTPATAGSGVGGQAASFEMLPELALYGGFAGFESQLSQRDWVTNITILSGDLGGGVQVWHVVSAHQTDASAVLDGFTIRDGRATEDSPYGPRGGGMLIQNGTATVRNCSITGNVATTRIFATFQEARGGGAYGAGVFENCLLTSNGASGYGGGAGGSGQFRDCHFVDNVAGYGGGGFSGWGTFNRCAFHDNRAGTFGQGGGAVAGGGDFTDCDFVGNYAPFDAGAISGGGTYTRCLFQNNNADTGALGYGTFNLLDCYIVGNRGQQTGFYQATIRAVGTTFEDNDVFRECAIDAEHCTFTAHFDYFSPLFATDRNVRLVNCLIIGNGTYRGVVEAYRPQQLIEILSSTLVANGWGGPAGHPHPAVRISHAGAVARIHNSILWNNAGETEEDQIEVIAGTLDIRRSIVQGWTGSLGGTAVHGFDPLFADAHGRLAPGSPAIDAGDTSLLPPSITLDLDGNPRLAEDSGTPNSGVGSPPIDIGAFEFQGQTCYANCDQSTTAPVLNIDDFTCFISRYAMGHPLANCDGSTTEPILDLNDFTCFIEAFTAGCP
jgi:hypothetical protein